MATEQSVSTRDRVVVDVDEAGVAEVRMVRTDRHNALDIHMFRALLEATLQLREDRSLRAVILHGEGKSFCSGLDVPSFADEDGLHVEETLLGRSDGEIANLAQRVAIDWARVPVPVIAAIHGTCFGGGAQIALGADLRIAAPDARICIMEVKWGLIPDMGISQTLPRLVGADVAKELTWSGRTLSGTEADALGVVTRCADDPLAAARALAADIAAKSPNAIRDAKRLYDSIGDMSPAEALALEADLQRKLIGSPNQMAAAMAAMTKQPATFADPE